MIVKLIKFRLTFNSYFISQSETLIFVLFFSLKNYIRKKGGMAIMNLDISK